MLLEQEDCKRSDIHIRYVYTTNSTVFISSFICDERGASTVIRFVAFGIKNEHLVGSRSFSSETGFVNVLLLGHLELCYSKLKVMK